MGLKLYFSKNRSSFATRIMLHEVNNSCEYESVDLVNKLTAKGEDYLTINPKGKIPALLIDDKALLTENVIILQYLAEKNNRDDLLPPIDDFQRYHVLEILNFLTSDVLKALTNLLTPSLSDEVKSSVFFPMLKRFFEILNDVLSKNKYLSGDHFTLPDIYFFTILGFAPAVKIDLNEYQNLQRYFTELQNRPSIASAIKEEQAS